MTFYFSLKTIRFVFPVFFLFSICDFQTNKTNFCSGDNDWKVRKTENDKNTNWSRIFPKKTKPRAHSKPKRTRIHFNYSFLSENNVFVSSSFLLLIGFNEDNGISPGLMLENLNNN